MRNTHGFMSFWSEIGLSCPYVSFVSANGLWDLYPALLANKSEALHLLKYSIAISFQVNRDSPRHHESMYRGSQVWQIVGNSESFFGSMSGDVIHFQVLKSPLHLDSVMPFLWTSERETACVASRMFRGMIWIRNVFTWQQEKFLMERCYSMALLGLWQVLTLLNFWASRQNGFRNGYQKPPAEQTRWKHAKKKKTHKIILANESTGEEILGMSLSKCDSGRQTESLSDSALMFFLVGFRLEWNKRTRRRA